MTATHRQLQAFVAVAATRSFRTAGERINLSQPALSLAIKNLEELGIELDKADMKKVAQKVIELGDKKETVTKEDLPYIISDVLRSQRVKEKIKIRNYSLSVADGLRSMATLSIEIDKKVYEETASGDGQYDAFMKALWRIYERLEKKRPVLTDYVVSIPPGGKTDALVECMITWDYEGRTYKTRGLDSDQTVAAIKSTLRMLNIVEGNGNGTV